MSLSLKITGTGCALPDKVLTNADLSKIVETSDEWITTRTGIKERRIAGENIATSRENRRALDAYVECQRTGIWPAGPDKVLTVDLPEWAKQKIQAEDFNQEEDMS
jgi:hypothetical protein